MKKDKYLYKKEKSEQIKRIVDKQEETSFNQTIFKMFIQLGGLVRLTDWLNENGYRVKTKYKGHKWTSPELRGYILDPENQKGISDDLKILVCTMVNFVGKSSNEQRQFRALKIVENEKGLVYEVH